MASANVSASAGPPAASTCERMPWACIARWYKYDSNCCLACLPLLIRKKMNNDDTEIQAAIKTALDEAAETRLEQIKQDMPRLLSELRAFRTGFELRLYERWAPALDLYETIVVVATEAGRSFNEQHRPR